MLVAATNRPDRVDPALLRSGRFDYIVRLDKPTAAERASILRLHLAKVPLAAGSDAADIDDLAARTDGWTGADLESACKRATLVAIADYQRGGRASPFAVTRGDFETVIGSRFNVQGSRFSEGEPGAANLER